MKKSDLQTGVIYAHKPGKYDVVKPCVLLDVSTLYRSNSDRWGRSKPGSPLYVPTSATRPGSGYDETIGYLAVSNTGLRYSTNPSDPIATDALLGITLEQALAQAVHQGETLNEGYTVTVVNNVALVGLYDEVTAEAEALARVKAAGIATRNAEAQAWMDAATARYDAFLALGVTLPAPVLKTNGWGDDKHSYAENAREVTLDAATLDQILALLQRG